MPTLFEAAATGWSSGNLMVDLYPDVTGPQVVCVCRRSREVGRASGWAPCFCLPPRVCPRRLAQKQAGPRLPVKKQKSPAGRLDLASQGCLSPAVLCQAVPEIPRSCCRPCFFQAMSWADTRPPPEKQRLS